MDQVKIGQFIAALRRERELSQRELAEALSLPLRMVVTFGLESALVLRQVH